MSKAGATTQEFLQVTAQITLVIANNAQSKFYKTVKYCVLYS